jgi:hypothetical protein
VVAFVDFADPWKHALGCYQDLTLSRQRPMVGGSIHDAELRVTQ